MWAFFVPFTITSTTLYVVQPLFSFIQAKKLLSKKTCVLNKNRRTKGVSCKRSLSSFALMLDVSPPLNFQPFTRVQKQDCHLPLKSFYCVPFFLFYHVICFSDYSIFPIKSYNCRLNRRLSQTTFGISARLVVRENKSKNSWFCTM